MTADRTFCETITIHYSIDRVPPNVLNQLLNCILKLFTVSIHGLGHCLVQIV